MDDNKGQLAVTVRSHFIGEVYAPVRSSQLLLHILCRSTVLLFKKRIILRIPLPIIFAAISKFPRH